MMPKMKSWYHKAAARSDELSQSQGNAKLLGNFMAISRALPSPLPHQQQTPAYASRTCVKPLHVLNKYGMPIFGSLRVSQYGIPSPYRLITFFA
jgi:hypothetical protein